MYPEVRAAVEADTSPDLSSPGFDLAAHREEVRRFNLRQPREDVAGVEDLEADGVPCRLFTPQDALPGVIVHAHGGGFVLNDIDVHDAVCRVLANRARRAVLSVDYRRPPEHPFPAAPDDLDAVVRWLAAGHGPTGPYAAHGDSAGANLAVVAALRNPGFFAVLALVYPFLDPPGRLPVVGSRDRSRASTRGRRAGTGSSTPAPRPTTTTPTWRRCSPTGCTPCRPPSSRAPSTIPCVTRGRSWRD